MPNSSTAQEQSNFSSQKEIFKPGVCYQAYLFKYSVIQKIDATHYFAVRTENAEYPNLCMIAKCHAIIELHHFNPNLSGYLNALVEYKGTINTKLANGFETQADILKECTEFHECEDGHATYCAGKAYIDKNSIELEILAAGDVVTNRRILKIEKQDNINLTIKDIDFKLEVFNENKKKLQADLSKALQYLKSVNYQFIQTHREKPDKKFKIRGLGSLPVIASVIASVEAFDGNSSEKYFFTINILFQDKEKPAWIVIHADQLEKMIKILSKIPS